MRVFKFGGASVKNVEAVRNVKSILDNYPNEKIAVVISAMGKTTNAFEKVTQARWEENQDEFINETEALSEFHFEILKKLVEDRKNPIYKSIETIFDDLKNRYFQPKESTYDCEYDQIVSIGEVLSTKIVTAYLQQCCLKSAWVDVRELITTNNDYRNGEVDWETTDSLINTALPSIFENVNIVVTQGFTAKSKEGKTITLGREGSDYSAGILAFCLNAENVTIWKDVPGMLNADPKYFDDTIKLNQISFREAIELAYYGASVIHPKTVQPLQHKNIPLYVKSFIYPKEPGTLIQSSTEQDHLIPSFIFKMNQVLFSITPKDFSFIVEKNLSYIFSVLHDLGVKINIMQNSALSFSFLADIEKIDVQAIAKAFDDRFDVRYNENVELVTIRHYDNHTIKRVCKDKVVLMEQRTRETMRIVLRKNLP